MNSVIRPHHVLARGACVLALLLAGAAHATDWPAADLIKASGDSSPWSPVGIGGGGTFLYAAGSPHDPNLVFVSSDMGQLFRSTDAGRNWRMLDWRNTPHVKSPVFHPLDPNIIYACDYGGDVLRRSTDKGVLWRPVGGEIPPWHGQVLLMIAIHRANPSFLLLTSRNGVFRSLDAGEKWEAVRGAPAGMMNVFLDPASRKDQPVCFGANADGVYRSDDGGITWAAKSSGLPYRGLRGFCGGSDGKKIMLYCLLPSKSADSGVVGGVWRSADGGESWESAMGKGIRTMAGDVPDQFPFMAMAATHPDTVYVTNTGTDGAPPGHYTVFRTDDGGRTWKDCFYNDPRSNNGACNTEVSWLTYDRSRGFGDRAWDFSVNSGNPDEVFYPNLGEIFITTNGCKTWCQAFSHRADGQGRIGKGQRWESCGSEDTTCWRYLFDPHDRNRTYICYTDIGFARSEDRGKSWYYDSKDRPSASNTYDLAPDPDVAGVFWGAFSDMHDIPTWSYTQGPGKKKGGIAKSTDHCKNWTRQGNGLPDAPALAIVIDPTSPKTNRTLYACIYGHGVYKSADGGNSWAQKSNGIEPAGNRQMVSIKRWKDGALFCSVAARRAGNGVDHHLTGGLYLSTDNAETWTRISSDDMFRCVDFAVDPEDRQIIYMAAMDGLQHKGGVYRTTDGGKTWENPPVPYDKHVESYIEGMTMTVHPRMRNVIFFCSHTHGIFISRDFGKTWSELGPLKSPPFGHCTRIFWDPEDSKIAYVVTFGGGVWRGPDPALE